MKHIVIITAILFTITLASVGILFISKMKSLPEKHWLNVKQGMNVREIENIVGKPNHPSQETKEMDRWIIDSTLFNSRLIVYYRNHKQPLVASRIEITRYCKLTGTYTVKIIK